MTKRYKRLNGDMAVRSGDAQNLPNGETERSEEGISELELPSLPELPKVRLLVSTNLVYGAMILAINSVAAFLSFLFGHEVIATSTVNFVCWMFGTKSCYINQGDFIVIGFAMIAQMLTMLGPANSLLKESIRFFHWVELCDRVAHEINGTAYVDPASVQERRNWAGDIIRNYVWRRRLGKLWLMLVDALIVLFAIGPWVVLMFVRDFHWPAVIAGSLVLPAAYDVYSDMWQLIRPNGKSQLLLGAEEDSHRHAARQSED